MPANMEIKFRNRINDLGQKGKRLEGQVLKSAGGVLASAIADHINRSKKKSESYQHLKDNIVVSNVKTTKFGERFVQVGAVKGLGYRLKFLEFGTSKMNAQAPVTKGADTSKDEVATVLSEGMERILKL
ncbi:HK97-gp10 family putative phage morphogenesis protein [Terrihalobacillus insolitus]|uniref:HK97-gp10 family putative phage morphogenesis protein n=1 Tax=Terrihalobacillus insolitus TaxID=2950438 RepID=UPI002341F30D|nr:HK97-gp10 family putative phage morphogenesis protein [Terrihalobacillus insolitus]MDC3412528.1 HK97 gp10 family phage protein [Terrihalobacillus insolitus]